MSTYIVSFQNQRFLVKATDSQEAKEKARKRLERLSGLSIPLSYIRAHKKPYYK